jgi:hypothetical protein
VVIASSIHTQPIQLRFKHIEHTTVPIVANVPHASLALCLFFVLFAEIEQFQGQTSRPNACS